MTQLQTDLFVEGRRLLFAGRWTDAAAAFRRLLEDHSNNPACHASLAQCLIQMGDLAGAKQHFKTAVELDPQSADAFHGLAAAVHKAEGANAALVWFERALALRKNDTKILTNYAFALIQAGKPIAAKDIFQKSIAISPNQARSYVGLASCLRQTGQWDEAATMYEAALALDDGLAEAHIALGEMLIESWNAHTALPHFQRAFELGVAIDRPQAALTCCAVLGQFSVMRQLTGKIMGAGPVKPTVRSNALMALLYDPEISPVELTTSHITQSIYFDSGILVASKQQYANTKIRIGYVSTDFNSHVCACFLYPLILNRDRSQFEVVCYSSSRRHDEMTDRFRENCDHWRDISSLYDSEAAKLIQDDGIDILVDCNGHTAGGRLTLLSMRPAPVTISFLGYPCTTGLSFIDYRLTDPIADPSTEKNSHASETLVRLEHGFLSYLPLADPPEPTAPPCITNGYITFGSFSNWMKINPLVRWLWADILLRVPNSRLRFKDRYLSNPRMAQAVKDEFNGYGILPDRIEIVPHRPILTDHFLEYHGVDIALDPFPYNGTTTTCDALWMGVPVVSLLGDRHAGRVAAGILTRLGLPDLVAKDNADYIRIAAELAANRARLVELRQNLRTMFRNSPLGRPDLVVRDIEKFYTAVVRGGPVPFLTPD